MLLSGKPKKDTKEYDKKKIVVGTSVCWDFFGSYLFNVKFRNTKEQITTGETIFFIGKYRNMEFYIRFVSFSRFHMQIFHKNFQVFGSHQRILKMFVFSLNSHLQSLS